MKLPLPWPSSALAPSSRIPVCLPSPTMEAPLPCPPLRPPPAAGENIILCVAAALPVFLGFVPIVMYLLTGSIEKAARMFRMPTMAAALTSSMAWLFYSLVVQRADPSWMDITTANAFLLVMNYNFIMLVWANKRSVFNALALSVIVLPGVTYLFMAMRWPHLFPASLHSSLATAGIFGQLGCYTLQIWDSVTGQDDWEIVVTALNFFPSLILNFCVCYITWFYHPDHSFLWVSSVINCVACTIGLMTLVLKFLKDNCQKRQEAANDGNNDEYPDPESALLRKENLATAKVRDGQIIDDERGVRSSPASSQGPGDCQKR